MLHPPYFVLTPPCFYQFLACMDNVLTIFLFKLVVSYTVPHAVRPYAYRSQFVHNNRCDLGIHHGHTDRSVPQYERLAELCIYKKVLRKGHHEE